MAPTASDVFTRFTSTSPTASSKLPSNSTLSPFHISTSSSSRSKSSSPTSAGSSPYPPGPPNETPQEKVARLRAASRRAKELASTSKVESAIDRGRKLADRMHRFTAYSLIGFAGISSILAIYAGFDLVLHNRRQKRAWIDRELQRLQEAREAFIRGDPTPEHLHLLQQERAGDEMAEKAKRDKERKKRESWWGRGKAAIIGVTPSSPSSEGGEEAGETSGQRKKQTDEARYGRIAQISKDAVGIPTDSDLSSPPAAAAGPYDTTANIAGNNNNQNSNQNTDRPSDDAVGTRKTSWW